MVRPRINTGFLQMKNPESCPNFVFKSAPVYLTHLLHLKHVINEETVKFLVCVIDAELFKAKKEKETG